MTRRVLSLLALTLTIGFASIAQAEDKPGSSKLFELRTYYTHEGRLPALNKRFREHTNKLFVKHGMELVGYWTPVDKNDTLIYIIAHKSKEAKDASWKAFGSDPEWKKAQAASEKDGNIVKKVESVLLHSTDYSPIK